MQHHRLGDYLNLLKEKGLSVEISKKVDLAKEVLNLTYNSKEVSDQTLFICKGKEFKVSYLQEAEKKGAVAYISQELYSEVDLPGILVSDIRLAMPILADLYFNSPSAELTLIAVGGTKGKTTTAFYVKKIFDEWRDSQAQTRCGILSTIYNFDGENIHTSHNTTPEAVELHRYLRQGLNNQMQELVMEVSSQALKYHRTDDLNFDISVFLNISEDHISPIEHPDFADYLQSKLLMFKQSKIAVVNLGTDYLAEVLAASKNSQKLITFSVNKTHELSPDYYASEIKKTEAGTEFKVHGPDFESTYTLGMPGLFNVENALSAIVIGKELGVPNEFIQSGLAKAKVKGRMEIFSDAERELTVIVDYAHNRLSFETLFSSMKKEYPDHSIIAVFGSPGGKALQRRAELGEVAGKYADLSILTADEPDLEPVAEISAQIAQHVAKAGGKYQLIPERSLAIETAIENAKAKSLIIVAGKGHEGAMKVGGQYLKYPSDVEIVKGCLGL